MTLFSLKSMIVSPTVKCELCFQSPTPNAKYLLLWSLMDWSSILACLESVSCVATDENPLYTVWSWRSRRVICWFDFTKPGHVILGKASCSYYKHEGQIEPIRELTFDSKPGTGLIFNTLFTTRYSYYATTFHAQFGQLLWSMLDLVTLSGKCGKYCDWC